MTAELLTETKKTVDTYNTILKIITVIVLFSVGVVGLVIGAWGAGYLASYIAALMSYPVDEISTHIGFFILIVFAIPFIIFGSRICFCSWRLVFVLPKQPTEVKNTFKRILLELAYWLGAVITIPALHGIVGVVLSYPITNDVAGLGIAIPFLFIGITILIMVKIAIRRLKRKQQNS